MKRFLTLFGLGLLILFYQNCGEGFRPGEFEDDFITSVNEDPPTTTDATPPPPTPAEKAQAVFNAKCLSCHGPGSTLSPLTIINDINALAASDYIIGEFPERSILFQHLEGVQRSQMPPTAGQELTALEMADVVEWINSVQRPVVIPVSYTIDIQPILTNNCTACHDINNVSMTGIRFDMHSQTVLALTPGDSAASPLSLAIQGMGGATADILMPPAPATPLSATEIQMINDWIDAGAPFN